jgi:phosphate uptake regulator
MEPYHKRWIKEALDGLMGVEISEDYADHVVLLNLIDPTKFSFFETIEKLSLTSRAVLADAIDALKTGETSLAQDAYDRGSESAKLYKLLMRLIFQAAKNRKLSVEMNLPDISHVIVMTIATRELGRIAYYAMWTARHVAELTEKPDRAIIAIIQKMAKITIDMQSLAFKALLSRDLVSAKTVFEKMPQVRDLYEGATLFP